MQAIDFFCGAGGMTEGMKQAGIKVLAGVDNDEGFKQTYEANHPNSLFLRNDIKALAFSELQENTGIQQDQDDLIFIGCSPCQYWSKMNTIKTKSRESRYLLRDFTMFIDHFNPGYVVIENVPGIFNKKDESPLPNFLAFLESKGYGYDYKTINTHYYGVPQKRRRFILIASRVTKYPEFPSEEPEGPVVKDYIGTNLFPKIGAGHRDHTSFLHATANLSERNLKRLSTIKQPGGNRENWSSEDQNPAYQKKGINFTDVYGRMWWNKPAPTITTKFHSLSNGRFGHPEQNRAISLREGACLQTFPVSYIFKGSGMGNIAKQIGNAVPPELAKRIGLSIKSYAHGRC